MSTLGVVRSLGELFLWIGVAGGALALLCGIVLIIALARASAGVVGGAVAVWIGAALLSLAAGFSGQWIPSLVAAGALVAGLIIGALARSAVHAIAFRPRPEQVTASDPVPAAPPVPMAPPAPVVPKIRPASARTALSESIR